MLSKSLNDLFKRDLPKVTDELNAYSSDELIWAVAPGTNNSAGNLSVQLDKLQEAGYISISKSFKGKKPVTRARIARKGIKAFKDYINALEDYLKH